MVTQTFSWLQFLKFVLEKPQYLSIVFIIVVGMLLMVPLSVKVFKPKTKEMILSSKPLPFIDYYFTIHFTVFLLPVIVQFTYRITAHYEYKNGTERLNYLSKHQKNILGKYIIQKIRARYFSYSSSQRGSLVSLEKDRILYKVLEVNEDR